MLAVSGQQCSAVRLATGANSFEANSLQLMGANRAKQTAGLRLSVRRNMKRESVGCSLMQRQNLQTKANKCTEVQ